MRTASIVPATFPTSTRSKVTFSEASSRIHQAFILLHIDDAIFAPNAHVGLHEFEALDSDVPGCGPVLNGLHWFQLCFCESECSQKFFRIMDTPGPARRKSDVEPKGRGGLGLFLWCRAGTFSK